MPKSAKSEKAPCRCLYTYAKTTCRTSLKHAPSRTCRDDPKYEVPASAAAMESTSVDVRLVDEQNIKRFRPDLFLASTGRTPLISRTWVPSISSVNAEGRGEAYQPQTPNLCLVPRQRACVCMHACTCARESKTHTLCIT